MALDGFGCFGTQKSHRSAFESPKNFWLENAAPKDAPSGTQMDPVLLLVLFLHLLPEIWHLGRSTAPLRNLTL
jgi:hypothetical protein